MSNCEFNVIVTLDYFNLCSNAAFTNPTNNGCGLAT
ncbi:MAG: hypothetical protein ACI9Q4_001608, partial [Sediminicola sp.]